MHVISQHLAPTVWAVKCVTSLPHKHKQNPNPGERGAPLEILQVGGRQKDGFPLFTAARLGQTDQTQCAFTILFPIKVITRPLDLCAAGYRLLLRFNFRAILKGEAQRLSTVTSSQGYAG